MTRPIEKVERTSKLQTFVLIFDLANIILFIVAGIYQQELQFQPFTWAILKYGFIFTNVFFVLTVVFYCLTVFSDPGYVPRNKNFLGIL